MSCSHWGLPCDPEQFIFIFFYYPVLCVSPLFFLKCTMLFYSMKNWTAIAFFDYLVEQSWKDNFT